MLVADSEGPGAGSGIAMRLNLEGRMMWRAWLGLLLSTSCLSAQSVLLSDNFEGAGSTVSATVWPYTSGTHVEAAQNWFGATNRYFRVSGGGVKALSANWNSQLAGKVRTFAFEYYEPSSSGDSLVTGYAAGTSDINTAGAFVRISMGGGIVSFNGTDGTSLTNSAGTNYPTNTRLTFSLVLNDSPAEQTLNGRNLPGKRMDVWYYNWASKQTVYVLSADVAVSTRSPVCVGFRTWSASTNFEAGIDNVLLLDGPAVVTEGFVPLPAPELPLIPPRPFAHPSVFNSQEELDRIRYRVLHEPTAAAVSGWNQMRGSSYASLSYQHVPYSNVVVMASGTTPSEDQFRDDAHAARAAALQWAVTGTTAYRDKAKTILNDWANTFVTMSPASGTSSSQIQLEAAWAAPIWVAAADIIRYHNGGASGWSAAEVAKFDGMLDYLYAQSAKAAGNNNNWGASAALTMMLVGAYQNDRARFDAGVQTWRDRLVGINAAVSNNGFIYEVCRDTVHPQYTLQVWMQAADLAWKEGLDLYGTRIGVNPTPQFAINLENFARLFLSLAQPPCSESFLTNYNYAGEQQRSGAYDIAYNHYITRMGSTAMSNYADMAVNHWRPGGFDGHFCGWSTLTHGDLSVGIPVVNAFALWNTSSNSPGATLTNGQTLNLHSLNNDLCTIAPSTTGTVASVQYRTNGVNAGAAVSTPPFRWVLPQPGNYWLSAVPWQQKSAGSIPGDACVQFLRVIELPEPWALHTIGSPASPAWVKHDGTNVTLCSPGAGMSGSSDQFGFAQAEFGGAVQLTARISTTLPSLAKAGLMVRDGVAANAANVLLGFNGGALGLQYRATPGGQTSNLLSATVATPVWVRLVRLGDEFSAYYSADAKDWSALGTASVAMNATVQAGVAVAGGGSDTAVQIDFGTVVAEPLTGSFADWAAWMLERRGVSTPALLLPGADPDGDGRSNQWEYWLGSDPLASDSTKALRPVGLDGAGRIRLRCFERKNAAELGRVFLFSSDLRQWTAVNPVASSVVQDLGSTVVREATFEGPPAGGFYRVGCGW